MRPVGLCGPKGFSFFQLLSLQSSIFSDKDKVLCKLVSRLCNLPLIPLVVPCSVHVYVGNSSARVSVVCDSLLRSLSFFPLSLVDCSVHLLSCSVSLGGSLSPVLSSFNSFSRRVSEDAWLALS